MKYNLSKFVGRNQLSGDEVAFERLAKVFNEPVPEILNTQRRQRVSVSKNSKLTKLSEK